MEMYSANKKEVLDTYYNQDKPSRNVKWKKPDIKGGMLYYFIYAKCPEGTDLERKKVD